MKVGDHIRVNRTAYYHHGIYIGEDLVIHFTGDILNKMISKIEKTNLATFSKGDELEVVEYKLCKPINWTVDTAYSFIGKKDYNLIFNNCEHFATYCKTGKNESKQVKNAAKNVTGIYVANVMTSLVAAPIMPVLAVGYGIKKFYNWLTK